MDLEALYHRIISPERKFYHVPLHLLFQGVSVLYCLGLGLNRLAHRWGIFPIRSLDARVISVGNLTLGGTGKTPIVLMIAGILRDQGLKPAVLSRGYGGCGSLAHIADHMIADRRATAITRHPQNRLVLDHLINDIKNIAQRCFIEATNSFRKTLIIVVDKILESQHENLFYITESAC